MVVSNTAETCGFKGFLENNNGTAGIFLFPRHTKSRPDQGAIYEHRGLVLTLDAAPYEDRSRRRRSECGERAGTARGGECRLGF